LVGIIAEVQAQCVANRAAAQGNAQVLEQAWYSYSRNLAAHEAQVRVHDG
jgi:hypothetical protein